MVTMARRLCLTSAMVLVMFSVVCIFQSTMASGNNGLLVNTGRNAYHFPAGNQSNQAFGVPIQACPKLCKCLTTTLEMTCSGNLTYIPTPPPYITGIIMRNASLSELTAATFINITILTLSHLELYKSGISHVEADAFVGLKFLYGALLILSGNPLNFTELGVAFCALSASNVTRLQLDELSLKVFPPGLLDCLRGSAITGVSLQKNNFTTFSGLAISHLEKLKILNLTHNNIDSLRHVEGFRNLTRMELRWNSFTTIPHLFNKSLSGDNPYPKLQTLRLGSNPILRVSKEDFIGLRNLEYLELKFNKIDTLPDNLLTEMPKLRQFLIKHNNLRTISSLAFNSSSLSKLDLSSNAFHFSSLDTKNVFKFCPNLDFLYLTDNFLDINDYALKELFSPLRNLTRLIIENMRISVKFPSTLFKALPSLQELIASSNTIASWDTSAFKYATKLEKLYLNFNKIITISNSSFPIDFLANLKKLNLAGNPFACTCDLLWFRNWLRTTNVTVLGINSTAYTCHTPRAWRGKMLLLFNPTAESCAVKEPNLTLILGSTLGGVAFVALIATVVLVRYRWHIHYCCFLTRSKLKGYSEIDDIHNCTFDAFVVYSEKDRHWVIQQLLPRIEYEEGFKLCLYDRDFIPGSDIVDNIITHMENSRKVMLILSDNFAASEWCKWEMKMAQHKLLDDKREILILLKLDNIQPCNMTKRLALLMRDKIYIDWADSELGQDMFWKKLIRVLSRNPKPIEL